MTNLITIFMLLIIVFQIATCLSVKSYIKQLEELKDKIGVINEQHKELFEMRNWFIKNDTILRLELSEKLKNKEK